MQLKLALRATATWLGLLLAAAGSARAEGEITMRGVYYKERSTRVVQPMIDARAALDDDTELDAHTLVDVITSASAAAGAAGTPFTERRYELGAGLTHRIGDYTCGLSGRFSYEPDYTSGFGAGRCQAALAQQNTLIGLGVAAGNDGLSNAGARDEMSQAAPVTGKLRTVLLSTSVTQVLSPLMVAGVTYDLMYIEGFLESPYRRVPVGGGMGMLVPEAVPSSRLRHALFGSVRGFVPATRSTWIAGYRFYLDDWDIQAHTPELRVVQELRPALDLHARYRFHWQSEAYFYQRTYAALEPFLTSDVKLSEFTTHTFGLELQSALTHLGQVAGLLGDARVELVLEYVVQRNRLGNAIVFQTALAMPFGE
jgi:hypothetical protein